MSAGLGSSPPEPQGARLCSRLGLWRGAASALGSLAFALAFALGFSVVSRGMAARHYDRPLVRLGDVVRIGEDQGRVVRYGATAIVLATDDGERIVPCLRFLSNTVQVRPAADAAEEP
jgi:hypothetical protein